MTVPRPCWWAMASRWHGWSASHSETVDFVHQYRMHDHAHDYAWEERWVRDEGYLKIVPRAVSALLVKSGVDAASVTHFCMPGTLSRIGAAVAKRCGLGEDAVRDNLAAVCGDTGVAHPLLMLAAALEDAKPGDRILLAAFGEGCDALLFEVTPAVAKASERRGARCERRAGSPAARTATTCVTCPSTTWSTWSAACVPSPTSRRR